MSRLWFDLRFTLRLLGRAPAFTALSAAVIALALALALTIYVLVRNQGLEPLPIPGGDRYVALQLIQQESGLKLRGDQFHADTLQDLMMRSSSFETLGAARIHGSTTINNGAVTEAPWGTEISVELMGLTGTQPLMGRPLVEADARPDAPPVVLLGYRLWQDFFGGQPDIVGSDVRVDGAMHTVVGVMPEGFRYPTDHHLWRPLKLAPNSPPGDHSQHFTPIGILKPGVSIKQASREVAAIMAELQRRHPEHYQDISAEVIPYLYAAATVEYSVMNIVMLSAGASILLLACLNVGNLLLVRANERNQELVIRSALGGSRGRIIRQVLMESLLISLLGGALGLWLGTFGARFVEYQTEMVVGSSYLPFWMRFDISADVLALAATATLVIWLLAGGLPAWRAARAPINTALGNGSKGTAGRANSRVTTGLVTAEVVFSFFLLILSGAFVASVNLATGIDYGVNIDDTVSGLILFDHDRYPDSPSRLNYLETLVSELEQEPDVDTATYTSAIIGSGYWHSPFDVPDLDYAQRDELPMLQVIPIRVDYFEKMGVTVLEGRQFDTGDSSDSADVVIISKQMADSFWPGQSPIGKQIIINPGREKMRPPWRQATVVGVIRHIDQGQIMGRSRDVHNVYQPIAQFTPEVSYIVVKFRQQPVDFAQQVQAIATRIDRDTAITMIRPLETSVSINIRSLQALSELFVVVALIALVLAATGIYGVVSRSVILRTREMGIRRALGQSNGQTLKYFLKQGALFLLYGAAIGGSGAVMATYLLTSEFPSLLDYMGIIVIIVAALMTLLVLGASYLPARKMLRYEPAIALHHE